MPTFQFSARLNAENQVKWGAIPKSDKGLIRLAFDVIQNRLKNVEDLTINAIFKSLNDYLPILKVIAVQVEDEEAFDTKLEICPKLILALVDPNGTLKVESGFFSPLWNFLTGTINEPLEYLSPHLLWLNKNGFLIPETAETIAKILMLSSLEFDSNLIQNTLSPFLDKLVRNEQRISLLKIFYDLALDNMLTNDLCSLLQTNFDYIEKIPTVLQQLLLHQEKTFDLRQAIQHVFDGIGTDTDNADLVNNAIAQSQIAPAVTEMKAIASPQY